MRTIWSQSYGSSSEIILLDIDIVKTIMFITASTQNAFKFFWRNGATVSELHSDHIPVNILDDYNHVALVRNSNGDIVVYFNGYKLRHNQYGYNSIY